MKRIRPIVERGKLCGTCSQDRWIKLSDDSWGCSICRTAASIRYQKSKGPAYPLLCGARARAKKAGIPCTIRLEDIHIPAVCPVLGIPLSAGGTRTDKWDSPSLDQIRPEQGYVVGNIRVISYRANTLKNSATCAELEAVLQYMRSQTT